MQAIAVAARALFEGQVDLVLMHFEPQKHPPQMVFDLERSAICKQAEKTDAFFRGKDVPDEHREAKKYVTDGKEKPLIRASRARWPSWDGKHPGRWTGQNLPSDVARANELFPEAGLLEFYQLRYSPTCWGAHGSSLAGLRSTAPELVAGTYALQLETVERMALPNLRLILEYLGLYEKTVFDAFECEAEQKINSIR